MPDTADMVLPMLREMRTENATQHEETHTLLSKLLTGEFEQRIEALEKKVRELESHS
jgi:hypothetical protein